MTLTMLGLTLFYYQWSAPKEKFLKPAEAIAFVRSSDGTHTIRTGDSRLWTPLQEGDAILSGDAIRTAAVGELQIGMIGAKGHLSLESGTEIRLQSDGNELLVELLQGYLSFEDYSGLKTRILDGQNSWPLAEGTSNLRREKPEDALDINKPSDLRVQNPMQLEWISEKGDFEIHLNPEDSPPHLFTWKGGRPGIDLRLEWGPSRQRLTNQITRPSVAEKLEVNFPLGRHYWRWSLSGQSEFKSPTARALVHGKFPPAAVSPIAGAVIRPLDGTKEVELKWLPSSKFSEYRIEIAKSADLKNGVLERTVGDGTEATKFTLELGPYFWRVSGFDKNRKEWIRSKVHSFRFLQKEINRVAVRFLTRAEGPLHYATAEPSATLKWTADRIDVVKKWQLRYVSAGEDLQTMKAMIFQQNEALLKLPRPGLYKAQIEALNADDDVIGTSSILNFEALPFPKLKAPSLTDLPASLAANNRGGLAIQWPAVEGAKNYQIEIKSFDQPAQFFLSKESRFLFQKLMPGTYEMRILAIDESGRPGEMSERRQIVVPAISAIKSLKVRKVEVQ